MDLCWKLLNAKGFAPVSGGLKNEIFVSVAHGEPFSNRLTHDPALWLTPRPCV